MRDRLGKQTPAAQGGCWQASLAHSCSYGEAKESKGPVDLYAAERVAQGWATLVHPA